MEMVKVVSCIFSSIVDDCPFFSLQAKQKRRKGKDKGREERPIVTVHDKHLEDKTDEKKGSNIEEVQTVSEKPDALEDVSDVSDSVDGVVEVPHPDSEDRDASPFNWDTDASEVHPPIEASSNSIGGLSSSQNEMAEKRSSSVMDDSSSTCSTDSLPSVNMNGPFKGNSLQNYKVQKSPSRYVYSLGFALLWKKINDFC